MVTSKPMDDYLAALGRLDMVLENPHASRKDIRQAEKAVERTRKAYVRYHSPVNV